MKPPSSPPLYEDNDIKLFGVNNKFHMYIYPMIICGIDINSFVKKVSHDINAISSFNCHMQGSHLMKRKKNTKVSSRKVSAQTVCRYF